MINLKKTIICKGVTDFKINRKIKKVYLPKAGDLAVFKVLEIGKHSSVQGVNGNNCYIFEGDYIMAAFGNRYATDQFEGYVPTEYHKEYHILGKGGAVGILASMHAKLEDKGTTNLQLVGYVTDKSSGEVINSKYLNQETLEFQPKAKRDYKIILSLGSAMDSGKTTTAGFLCRGLRAAKKNVAYVKLTGTVYTKDRHFARDCGAHLAVDFSNFGFPSTYMCDLPELLNLHESLLALTEKINPDYVVIEIADGLLQRETAMLLKDESFMSQVSEVIFSAGDSLGILSGLNLLWHMAIEPFAVSGLFTASPLLIKEVEDNL
ncbi:MAG TPA: hypothetical protein ENJ53_09735, partial [Phaeodactylibacter sp.]|nr:hypothetical protein [Phaeodactylibacter sp.]